jgi:hypothetical protein
MTRYTDNIYSGNQAITSALSSKSAVVLTKVHRIAGGAASTISGTFPQGAQNLDAKLYIMLNASATVSDKITVSAAGVDLITITQFGSAAGVLRQTTTSLGVLTAVASSCGLLTGAANAELPYAVTYAANTQATGADYQLVLTFNRADTNTLGVTA